MAAYLIANSDVTNLEMMQQHMGAARRDQFKTVSKPIR